ncbi:hypothetical protein SpAn4DRAFT_0208 [Sporomusa ovata]|uniref:Uncharacterized protein n=1 Tax=Sporomusa ovata TaxID=2378 RepID=A0A0U1L243_9FIRM|nr:hypothetical protein SpAn4DRAFT_0208 [Sporomusa ovata]
MVLQQEQLQKAYFLAKELYVSQTNAIGGLQAAYEIEKRRLPAASFTV